ncbi:MAG: hypothetical protein K0S65_1566, partial [Labilithrix sp.]|nr:hypothetical protein [Labilithrix sp.]
TTAGGPSGALDDVRVEDGGAAAEDRKGVVAQDCSGLPISQAISQPCCLAKGIDACGANLFCAAFDGRKQPTCYAERSRLDMTECAEDRHCTSGSCNVESGQCRSMPGASCSEAIGCATVSGDRMICLKDRCTTSDGELGDPCVHDTDCTNGTCSAENRCVGKTGASCSSANDCGDGLCCKGNKCSDCRGGVGDGCGFFMECQPGLSCCSFPGAGSYCYESCN